jgi:dsDNA-binding SOS-regulon protein
MEEQVKRTVKRQVVSVYKTTDGKYFEDKKEYLKYQKDLDENTKLMNFCAKFSANSEEAINIANFMIYNKEELKSILK